MRPGALLFAIALLISSATLAQAVVTPIGNLHSNFANGIPLQNGQIVTVQGTVTVPNGIFSPTNVDVHIQDATGGIDFFVSGGVGTFSFALGDSVEVTGYLKHFNGLTEIDSSISLVSVTHLGPASVMPEPLVQTCQQAANSYQVGNVEPTESQLIRINGVSIVSGTWPVTPSGGNPLLVIQDATGTTQLFIDRDSPVNGSPQPAPGFDIIGVLRQFDSSNPYTSGYEIVPRFVSDVISAGIPGCTGPTLTAPVVSFVDSTSATITWTTDTPASSFVRYGLTTTYTDSVGNETLTTSHSVSLTGLDPRTLYHFDAKSTDVDGTCYSVGRALMTFPLAGTPGEIAVYFNQSVEELNAGPSMTTGRFTAGNVDLRQPLLALIDSAKVSIDAAFYYFDLPEITDALIAAKNRGVQVRLIVGHNNPQAEANRAAAAGIPFIPSNYGGNHTNGIMHDKYVLVDVKSSNKDDAYLFTGSWNCFPGAQQEANNVITFHDYGLPAAYTLDFDQMWGSSTTTPNSANTRMGDRKVEVIPHQFLVGGIRVEAYMSPSDQPEGRMIQYIQQAQYSQLFCIFDFTSDPLSLAMRAHRDSIPGFEVRGCFEDIQVAEFSEWCKLDGQAACPDYWTPRADVFRDASTDFTLLHHKYQIFDHNHPGATVWTGSHNWSNAAKTTNDENTVVVHDPTIANLYFLEWYARYLESGGGPLTAVPTAHSASSIALSPCRPNPMSRSTTIDYALGIPASDVNLAIYDVSGRKVKTLFRGPQTAGSHSTVWDGVNESGQRERPGVFFYRFQAGAESVSRLLVLAR